ncbi:DNA polymerase III subunit delta' [Desulfogranum japonicum]|uniref:DNA polymerase III subunit delta' n=1 Tax=Desulfogranum japonicum TaxID=231447 RepID=UPI0003FC05D3|nr:DNA polymerase III subunit delta' [Desulfogranum japonicum]
MFAHILGQTKAVTFFQRAISSDRLSHSYLLHGPDGVGKRLLAEQIAAVLLCQREQGEKPCGNCPGCQKYLSGNHPDLLRITPDGPTIKIAQIRGLKQAVTYAPFEKGYRIILIEDVHTMRREAGNSLLKILEEPPAQNIFLLLSASLEVVLATIRSRCQLIPLYSLPFDLAARIIQQKDPELPPDEAFMLAQLADGSPGKALSLNSSSLYPLYTESLEALLAQRRSEAEKVEAGLALAAKWTTLKDDLPYLFHLFRIFFKDAMVPLVFDQPGTSRMLWLDKARERWNFRQLSAKIDNIDYAEQALQRNCNKGLACEVLALQLLT